MPAFELWECRREGRKLRKYNFVGYADSRDEAREKMDRAFKDRGEQPIAVYGNGLEMLRERRSGCK